MKRVKDVSGVVHFRGKDDCITLCGAVQSADLLGRVDPMERTASSVTCPHCAVLYCRIKNAPWNEVDADAMDAAIYDDMKEEEDVGKAL